MTEYARKRDLSDMGVVAETTEQTAVDASVAITLAAKRVYGVDDIAELTPEQRLKLREDIDMSLNVLGVKKVVVEWITER